MYSIELPIDNTGENICGETEREKMCDYIAIGSAG